MHNAPTAFLRATAKTKVEKRVCHRKRAKSVKLAFIEKTIEHMF